MNQIDTGKFIASCRKEKGLTQAQLAEKLSITDRAVSKWETGKCMPDLRVYSNFRIWELILLRGSASGRIISM